MSSHSSDTDPKINVLTDELRAIHPRGLEIAKALIAAVPYNKICKKHHVAPNTVSKISTIIFRKPQGNNSAVQELLGNDKESEIADQTIVAAGRKS